MSPIILFVGGIALVIVGAEFLVRGASRLGQRDIAVGNVVGSNVFNILGVLEVELTGRDGSPSANAGLAAAAAFPWSLGGVATGRSRG